MLLYATKSPAAQGLTAETLPSHCPWPKGAALPKARPFPSSSLYPVTGQCGGQFLSSSQNTLKGQPNSRAPCALCVTEAEASVTAPSFLLLNPASHSSSLPPSQGYFPINSLHVKVSLKLFAMDWTIVCPPNSYAKTLTPNVTGFGDRASGR